MVLENWFTASFSPEVKPVGVTFMHVWMGLESSSFLHSVALM